MLATANSFGWSDRAGLALYECMAAVPSGILFWPFLDLQVPPMLDVLVKDETVGGEVQARQAAARQEQQQPEWEGVPQRHRHADLSPPPRSHLS